MAVDALSNIPDILDTLDRFCGWNRLSQYIADFVMS